MRYYNSILFKDENFYIPMDDESQFVISMDDVKNDNSFRQAILNINSNALTPWTLKSFIEFTNIILSERFGLDIKKSMSALV